MKKPKMRKEITKRKYDNTILPTEIWVHIYHHIDAQELYRCLQVCTHWNSIITNSRILWQSHLYFFLYRAGYDNDHLNEKVVSNNCYLLLKDICNLQKDLIKHQRELKKLTRQSSNAYSRRTSRKMTDERYTQLSTAYAATSGISAYSYSYCFDVNITGFISGIFLDLETEPLILK